MKNYKQFFLVTLPVMVLFLSFCNNAETTDAQPVTVNGDSEVSILNNFSYSPPINYKNLQLFMITGTTTADNISYVSLKVAMENNWVEIIETSTVNELQISNLSSKVIFINAGDIVKGGKQDRTLTYDMIIEPKSKGEKLSSFCVEHDRWNQRGNENSKAFGSAKNMLTSRKLKISSKKANNQSAVWESVSDQQEKLNSNVSYYKNAAVNVKENASGSSLELTLDNKELKEMQAEYREHFNDLLTENTVGFAYAINGELYTVDIYNNKQLFLELFDKLLTSAIVEAITDLDSKQNKHIYISNIDVTEKLKITKELEETVNDLNARTRWAEREDKEKIFFTSLDRKNDLKWVHKNIIIKDTNQVAFHRNIIIAPSNNIQLQEYNDERVK